MDHLPARSGCRSWSNDSPATARSSASRRRPQNLDRIAIADQSQHCLDVGRRLFRRARRGVREYRHRSRLADLASSLRPRRIVSKKLLDDQRVSIA